MSPCWFAVSQRPFAWMRSGISPAESAGPHGLRLSSTGKCPTAPARSDPVGADDAGVPDVDHIRACTLSPTRKPTRNTAVASRTHAGHRGRARAAPGKPVQAPRDEPEERGIQERHAGEDLSVIEEPERDGDDSSMRRSRFRSESGRRRLASPTRKTRQSASQTPVVDLLRRRTRPCRRGPSSTRPAGRSTPPRRPARVVDRPLPISPASPEPTFTVQLPPSAVGGLVSPSLPDR